MRLQELKQKEIINCCTCRNLGCPIDAEFDCCSGQICSLIVPGPGKLHCLFGKNPELVIPWKCIRQIGDDIILVEIQEETCLSKEE